MDNYLKLVERFNQLARIDHAETFLSWDEAVMMPEGGSEARAEALAELEKIQHGLLVDQQVGEWLALVDESSLSAGQVANLREMRRAYQQETCLEVALVEALSKAKSKCEHAWRTQRKENDWEGFRSNLAALVSLVREEARARQASGPEVYRTPYDALLSLYTEGYSSEYIDQIFTRLKKALPVLVGEIQDEQRRQTVPELSGHYPVAAQKALSLELMKVLGFDFEHGRLDESTHPFSTGGPGDHRITTRFDEREFIQALMATVHETGHARYEAGLPKAWHGQPAGEARSMAIHESQSLLFEKQIFLSEPFIRFVTPLVHRAFPHLSEVKPLQLRSAMMQVKPDFIRVHADEVTYPLHVILRYEIESLLINGKIEVDDIPDLWDDKMKSYLGLSTAGNYKDGCMQDVHWPGGDFGYFPSYALGALNAAQIWQAIQAGLSDVEQLLATGDLVPIFDWLEKHIWSKGSLLGTEALMIESTGEFTNPDYFLGYIRTRYLSD